MKKLLFTLLMILLCETVSLAQNDSIAIGKPTISSNTHLYPGTKVSAQTGTLQPVLSTKNYSYQWYRDSTVIDGAIDTTYTITPSDIGKQIKFEVTSKAIGNIGAGTKLLSDPTEIVEKKDENVSSLLSINSTLENIETLKVVETCLMALVVMIIALVVYILLNTKKRRDEIIDTLGEWKKWLVQEKEKKKQLEIMQQQLDDQSHKIEELQKRVAELENKPTKTKADDKTLPVTEPAKKLDSYLNLYANAIINGMFFNKVTNQSNDDTVYELTVTSLSDRTAKFTVYKEAYSRVLKNPDFVDGCDKQKLGNQSIEVEAGEAQKQDNDKWKVTKQAKVKFL
ncbi:hypothetical protein EZS27_008248 [termite gut metagenome]|uniref:Ig-like domain-containing protein n=1 Tax=termite gut metagenome TaxID=433724 RepID=A0A5J4SFP4_9ZZZZ